MNDSIPYVGGHIVCVLNGNMRVQHDVYDWIILYKVLARESSYWAENLILSNKKLLKTGITTKNLVYAKARFVFSGYVMYQLDSDSTGIAEKDTEGIDGW